MSFKQQRNVRYIVIQMSVSRITFNVLENTPIFHFFTIEIFVTSFDGILTDEFFYITYYFDCTLYHCFFFQVIFECEG